MIDKNDFDAIDLTRSTGHSNDEDLIDEIDFLRSLEHMEQQERQAAYEEQDYSLDEYMKIDPGVEIAGASERAMREQNAEKALAEFENVPKREKTEEEKQMEQAMADAPWNDEPMSDDDMDNMYRDYVIESASQYGLANANEVEFEKLAKAVGHLDDLYFEGKISKPIKTNGSLIVSDKGEVVVAGVAPASDWDHTTDAASDLVKNRNYDATLEDDGR